MRNALVTMLVTVALSSGANYDVLIKRATLVDGTGAAAVVADVGIADGRIERVGDLADETAREVIDATGLVLAPGSSTCIAMPMPHFEIRRLPVSEDSFDKASRRPFSVLMGRSPRPHDRALSRSPRPVGSASTSWPTSVITAFAAK